MIRRRWDSWRWRMKLRWLRWVIGRWMGYLPSRTYLAYYLIYYLMYYLYILLMYALLIYPFDGCTTRVHLVHLRSFSSLLTLLICYSHILSIYPHPPLPPPPPQPDPLCDGQSTVAVLCRDAIASLLFNQVNPSRLIHCISPRFSTFEIYSKTTHLIFF